MGWAREEDEACGLSPGKSPGTEAGTPKGAKNPPCCRVSIPTRVQRAEAD